MIEVTFASYNAVHEILFIMISASRFLEMDYLGTSINSSNGSKLYRKVMW